MTEIKYKDTTIPVEAGQTVTLNTTGKKLTGDVVITAPKAESGAEIYSIDWDISAISDGIYDIIFLPTTITKGQTVAGVIFISGSVNEDHSNCDLVDAKDVTVPNYGKYAYSGRLYSYEISNPMGDINITLNWTHSGGGIK